MKRRFCPAMLAILLPACESPSDRQPDLFRPSAYVAGSTWPELARIADLEAQAALAGAEPGISDAAAEMLAIRADALRARAIPASAAVLTPAERARLLAAAARWTGS